MDPARAIFLIALVIRLIYLAQYSGSPFYEMPMWDAAEYKNMATSLLRGEEHISWAYRPILYPLLVTLVYLIFGSGHFALCLVQIVTGCMSCVLVYRIGENLYSRTAGLIAGLLAAFSGMMFFYDLELSPTGSLLFCTLAGFWQLLQWQETRAQKHLVYSGLFWGLGALCWPAGLPMLLPVVIWVYFQSKRVDPFRSAFTLISGAALPLALSLMIHFMLGYGAIPISAHGGVNFYIGNARNADGMTARLPGIGVGWDWNQVEAIAESQTGRVMIPAEVDRYYWERGISEISADPLRWLRLMGRKLLLFWNRVEISNNQDFYYHSHRFPFFGWLMWIGIPLVLGPAIFGMGSGKREGILLIGVMILFFMLSVAFFFVNARFRQPIAPFMFIMAGGGIAHIVGLIRGRERWIRADRRWLIVALVFAGVIPSTIDTGISKTQYDYGYFTEGGALELMGRDAEAEIMYKAAAASNPAAPFVHFKLGELARKARRDGEAVRYYRRELEIQPGYSKTWNNLGVVLLEKGDEAGALDCFTKALSASPPLPEAGRNAARIWRNRGSRLLREGDTDSAAVCFQNGLQSAPEDSLHIKNIIQQKK